MTDVSNLDNLAAAIASSSSKIRSYAVAQAAATQSQEADFQAKIAALDARLDALEAPPPPPPLIFAKYASPSGSDSNPGTLASPYLTMKKVLDNLTAGQTGALRGGTYGSTTTYHNISTSGTATAPKTITAYPGETPVVRGFIEITGSYLTIKNLEIDGSNTLKASSACGTNVSESLALRGSNIIFEHNRLYQSVLGTRQSAIFVSGGGSNVIIRYNRIYDFGGCYHYDHGVYVGTHTGIQIHHNWIWNGAFGWGVHLYPSSVNAKVHHNVVDGCGSGFTIGDNGSATCTGNQIYNNVAVNAVQMYYETGSHPRAGTSGASPVAGTNNSFTDNDCWNNADGVGSQANVTTTGNITTDPQFVNAAARDYTIQSGSPIASWNMWNGV